MLAQMDAFGEAAEDSVGEGDCLMILERCRASGRWKLWRVFARLALCSVTIVSSRKKRFCLSGYPKQSLLAVMRQRVLGDVSGARRGREIAESPSS